MYGMASGFIVAILAFFIISSSDDKPSSQTIVAQNQQSSTQNQPKVDNKKPSSTETETQATKNPEPDAPTPDKQAEETYFEFYTLLPESEVIVPSHDEMVTTPSTPESTESITYMLQAGSFRNAADADRLRARLLLMGLEAKVQTVSVRQGETWHRVQVGPFKTTQTTQKAQTMLTNANIETLLLKLKP